MNCIICSSNMKFYFKKIFNEFALNEEVEYWRCENCGFCASKTHFEMPQDKWAILNKSFHNKQHYRDDNPYNRNNRYFEQALMIHIMIKNDLINGESMLDWGSGLGAVSKILQEQFSHSLHNYDEFFTPEINQIFKKDLSKRTFDFVLNAGVFEHVTSRETLDEIESYVKDNSTSCLGVHTLVAENIPNDPSWMYLLPVHCAFHTNKSMQILMDQWGGEYKCSVYNPNAKLWILFKEDPVKIKLKVEKVNKLVGKEYLYFKVGFMDYWK